jgi:hypothetical protein
MDRKTVQMLGLGRSLSTLTKSVDGSDMIFGHGLMPTGGWKVLKAGESFDFVKELPLRFF